MPDTSPSKFKTIRIRLYYGFILGILKNGLEGLNTGILYAETLIL